MAAPAFTLDARYTYPCEVVKVVDGDTIDVRIDVGFETNVYKRLRFLGIDTWEVRGTEREAGLIAKARLIELLESASKVFVRTEMDATGKYGRVLAWVWIMVDGAMICVNDILLAEGHGDVPSY